MRAAAGERGSRVMELVVDSIAAGGDGVARTEGLVVFVPRTAPGDRIRAQVTARRSFGRGRCETLLTPGPDRVEPPCAHYVNDRCGGCQVQHLRYAAQLGAKAGIIGDGLRRIGRREVADPPVESSPGEWRYRAKLTLAMRRRSVEDAWTIGLHPFDDPVGVFQLADCPITDERVVAVWREIFAAAHLLPAERALRGAVRLLDDDDGGASFVLEGGTSWGAREAFAAAVPSIRMLWWQPEGRPLRLLSEAAVDGSASFVQVNPAMAARMQAHVLDRVRSSAPATVVDAYAGTGATAIALARSGIVVTAIELDPAAARACAAALPLRSRMLIGRVEDRLPDALPADVVVLNPPRTGLADAVPAQLVAAAPRRIIYVSCNPATLGRDLARLPSYAVTGLRGFDMFPQTAHVETVCELTLNEESA